MDAVTAPRSHEHSLLAGWLARALEIEATLDRELEQVRSTLESQPPEPAAPLDPEAVAARHVREPLAPSSPAGPLEAAKEDAEGVRRLIDPARRRRPRHDLVVLEPLAVELRVH